MPDRILPPLRRTAADAEQVARVVHAGQTDKAGRPYIEHVGRVTVRAMARWMDLGMGSEDDDLDLLCQIAWLHDVLEPDERPFGPMTFSDLVDEGFGTAVVNGVDLLTRDPEMTYAGYIARIAAEAQPPILLVKLADLEDNLDPARLALLPADKAASLAKRYTRAAATIRGAMRERMG